MNGANGELNQFSHLHLTSTSSAMDVTSAPSSVQINNIYLNANNKSKSSNLNQLSNLKNINSNFNGKFYLKLSLLALLTV